MSIRVDSIEDDGVAMLICADDMNALEMSTDGTELEEVLGDEWATRRVIMDLSDAEYVDSAVIGWLLLLHKTFNRAGGRLVLYGLNPNVKRVIDLLRIDDVLMLATDRERALQRVRGGD